jgi:farnesyl-diphosphate farnesyltransferase
MNEKEILRRTSRSFYLTIRLLPKVVREDIALAYLLARATDTIADTYVVPVAERMSWLQAARHAVPSGKCWAVSWCLEQYVPAERELLRNLPRLSSRLLARAEPVRALLGQVMDHILAGQIFDLERFGPGALPLTEEELARYTYLVAGSVGEFWDDLCRLRLPNYTTAPPDLMRVRACRYGQALQLVNILRDRQMDDALGRVYVPAGQVAQTEARAREGLVEGASYCGALRSGRLRYATLLPFLLGGRTLSLVSAQQDFMITPAKVPRAELRRWMQRALPVWWSPAAVGRLVRQVSE